MAATPFVSPKLRYVQGDPFNAQTKDQQGNPMTIKTGPNAGQPTQAFILNGAIAKSDPLALPFLMQIAGEAAKAWPAFFPQGALPNPPMFGCTHPRFSLKIMDGDGIDDNGKDNKTKEGFAGHWIIKFKSSYAPGVYELGKYDKLQNLQLDKGKHSLLRRGYYVRVSGGIESNANDGRPGMYVNLGMIEIVQAGVEITTGPDAAQVFGGAGGGQTIAHSPTVGLIMTGAFTYEALKTQGWTDEAMIAAGYATRPAAAPSPPSAATPPPPPGAPVHVMLPAAGATTYEAYITSGWTDALLIQHGYMAAPVVAAPLPPSAATPPPPPGAPIPGASTPPAPGAPPATPSPSNPPPPPYSGYMQPPAKVMLPAAGATTYEAYIASGWTDAQLIQHGFMSPN